MKKRIFAATLALILCCCFVTGAFATEAATEKSLERIVQTHLNGKFEPLVNEVKAHCSDVIQGALDDSDLVKAVVKAGIKAYILSYLYENGTLDDKLMLYANDTVKKAVDSLISEEMTEELLSMQYIRDAVKSTSSKAAEMLVDKSGITADGDELIKSCINAIYSDNSLTVLYNPEGDLAKAESITLNKFYTVEGEYKNIYSRVGTFLGFIPIISTQRFYKSYTVTGWNQKSVETFCDAAFYISSASAYIKNIDRLTEDDIKTALFVSIDPAAAQQFNTLIAEKVGNPTEAFADMLGKLLSEQTGQNVAIRPTDDSDAIINSVIQATVKAPEAKLDGVLGAATTQTVNLALGFVTNP